MEHIILKGNEPVPEAEPVVGWFLDKAEDSVTLRAQGQEGSSHILVVIRKDGIFEVRSDRIQALGMHVLLT